jgi:RNA polymerase sigma factor (sigma-70 family)
MQNNMKKEYWRHIGDGRHEVFEDFYHDYFRKFYNFGRKFTKDEELIEDAIQDVFVEIWSKRNTIHELAMPKAYFFAAFKNILLQKLKTQSKIAGDAEVELEDIFQIDNLIIQKESSLHLHQQLSKALANLTPRQRQVIFLRFYERLSYEEIAVVMNITVKASYKIAARSLLALKSSMRAVIAIIFCNNW